MLSGGERLQLHRVAFLHLLAAPDYLRPIHLPLVSLPFCITCCLPSYFANHPVLCTVCALLHSHAVAGTGTSQTGQAARVPGQAGAGHSAGHGSAAVPRGNAVASASRQQRDTFAVSFAACIAVRMNCERMGTLCISASCHVCHLVLLHLSRLALLHVTPVGLAPGYSGKWRITDQRGGSLASQVGRRECRAEWEREGRDGWMLCQGWSITRAGRKQTHCWFACRVVAAGVFVAHCSPAPQLAATQSTVQTPALCRRGFRS